MATTQKLFTEIFRPKNLDGLILTPRVRNELSKGLVTNLILYSSTPGTGKTTIARILTEGYDVLKLNGSTENGIDVIRNQVVSFATSMSLELGQEKVKVIYIDEADGLTEQAWDALRETIEHYANSVRYICTCNKIDKIPNPIKSRFNCIPLFPINKDEENMIFEAYCQYVGAILSKLNIKHEDDVLKEFVKTNFPDMRSILNTIQALYLQGAAELDRDSLIKTFDCSDLFEKIVTGGDPVDNYKFIMENYSSSPDEAMLALSQEFVDFIRKTHPDYNSKIPFIIIAIAEYLAQLGTSPDRVIVLLACCFKLQTIIRS